MQYLPSTWESCESCQGRRFNEKALGITIQLGSKHCSIADVHEMPLQELHRQLRGIEKWPGKDKAISILESLLNTGLGYLQLGQPSPSLSGGEAQRIKLAKYLSRKNLKETLILLDEPSTGLHPANINDLLKVFDHLLHAGASIVIIEHNTDIIGRADWIIDLGPGAGPQGGELVYQGPLSGILGLSRSLTGKALGRNKKRKTTQKGKTRKTAEISIRHAAANNLKNISVDIPKNTFTVIGGVSGSGKSSLLHDVLELEARRRYLESLSMYERQNTRESSEAALASLKGLGVCASISPGKKIFNPRSTVGSQIGLSHHLAALIAILGSPPKDCDSRIEAKHFIPGNYGSACGECNGLGTRRIPNPGKLIINPEKPLTAGAMYSPGFFPQGYLGKPFNGGYYVLQALGRAYDFIPEKTPWNRMSKSAQEAFLYGS
ncbi:MAG: hypothetical protein MI862_05865, partial [Desulfobacterales bacterium]|nr:hypothetical protein [Desulfobacterales bacterium]